MKIVLLGPPGVGKGTVGKLLAKKLNLPHLIMGQIIRNEIASNPEFEKLAHDVMAKGDLIPHKEVLKLLEKELQKPIHQNGTVFDGIPRALDQAQEMHNHNIIPDIVIDLEAPDEVLITRLSNRRICKNGHTFNLISRPPQEETTCDTCKEPLTQREDDNPKTIKHRLELFKANEKDMIHFFKDHSRVIRQNAEGTPEEITHLLLAQIIGE